MLGCQPDNTPIKFNYKLGNLGDKVPVEKENLSHTRLDISYADTWRKLTES